MKKYIVMLGFIGSLLVSVFVANAQNRGFHGKVTELVTLGSDGSFMVYINNQELIDTCFHKRVYFRVSHMGIERTKLAFSMALTAFSADKSYGVIVDLPEVGGICNVSSTSSTGAYIR